MARALRKPPEGKKLPDSADMAAWRKEFEEMDLDTHLNKLKSLGLTEDELEEFKEMEEGAPLEEEIMMEGPVKKETKKKSKK